MPAEIERLKFVSRLEMLKKSGTDYKVNKVSMLLLYVIYYKCLQV